MFDDVWAEATVRELKTQGVRVRRGLRDRALDRIETAVGAPLPPELRLLWSTGLPEGDGWPDWRSDPEGEAARDRAWAARAFAFDVEHAQYWMEQWGARPEDDASAVALATEKVGAWPPLICVYSHRFMPSEPATPGGPVLSVYQAVDSVIYGNDLAHYLHREFGISCPPWSAMVARPVPTWGDAFDFFGERDG